MRVTSILFSMLILASLWAVPFPVWPLEAEWGGHFRVQESLSHYDDEHVVGLVQDRDLLWDGATDFRLKSTLFFSERLTLDVHYETGISAGDTRDASEELTSLTGLSLTSPPPSDDGRILSLTKVLRDRAGQMMYHRIDRLLAAYAGDRFSFRIGRQALSWGNGLIFNPLDLLNPFSPTDVIRDYKEGTDMLIFQTFGEHIMDFQAVWVPRRDTTRNRIRAEESSFAAKMRIQALGNEWDIMAARHYDDTVIGLGTLGYLGDAAWRADIIWTHLEDDDAEKNSTFSAVLDLDYSWIWKDKNWYGLIEFYYNGLGQDNPLDALSKPALSERMARGEIFISGRWYLASRLKYEAHPLLICYLVSVWNLEDRSAMFQPYIAWDAAEPLRVFLGATLPVGGSGSEFGDISVPGTDKSSGSPSRLYFQVTYFF